MLNTPIAMLFIQRSTIIGKNVNGDITLHSTVVSKWRRIVISNTKMRPVCFVSTPTHAEPMPIIEYSMHIDSDIVYCGMFFVRAR